MKRRETSSPNRRGVADPFNVTEEAVKTQNEIKDPFDYKTVTPEVDEHGEPTVKEKTDKDKEKTVANPFDYKDPTEEVEETETGGTKEAVNKEILKTEGEEEEVVEKEDGEINPYFYLGNALKKDGFLNGEVDENITSSEIVSNYKKSIQDEAIRQIEQEARQKLLQDGYDLEDLKYAKLLRSGTDAQLLRGVSKYDKLSKIKLDSAEEKEKKQLLTEYYTDREWELDEIEDQVERVILDDTLDEVAAKAIAHFKTKKDAIISEQEAAANRNKLSQEQQANQQKQRVDELIKSGKLLEEEIPNPKEFRRGVYEKDFIAERGGKEYPITELQSFLLSFDNDPETKLWAFAKWKYRNEEKQEIKEQAKKEAEEDLLGDYKRIITKSKAKTTTRKVKEALHQNKSNSDWVSPTGNRGPIVVGK